MKFSRREYVLALMLVGFMLFGISAILAKPKLVEWRSLAEEKELLEIALEKDMRLLQRRETIAAEFEELRQFLPDFPKDKLMDVHWLTIMDETATRYGVNILKRQALEEKRMGDVYELPLECREWEGTLDSLRYFLVDLQGRGAMLDIRQLLVRQKEGEVLRGRFTLFCAYTRKE